MISARISHRKTFILNLLRSDHRPSHNHISPKHTISSTSHLSPIPRPSFSALSSSRSQIRVMAAAASSNAPSFPSLVSAEWLKTNLTSVRVLDSTWYLPTFTDKNALEQFTQERIPGAQFFDLDGVADRSTDLPHMLPSEAQFAAAADALGISNNDAIVIYDRAGIFSAPRAWWTWHVFGHEKVAVLDGGLPAWKAAGGELDTMPSDADAAMAPTRAAQASPPPAAKYKATLRAEEVRDWKQILQNIESKKEMVLDARPAARWRGEAPEPRKGLNLGHIPGSGNVPWDSVLRDGKLKPAEELKELFNTAGVDVGKDAAVFSCGSGTTACILALALKQIDPKESIAIYDGSWSEWGGLESVPVGTAAGGQ